MKCVEIVIVLLIYDILFLLQMDESISAKHVRCLWSFNKFCVRELFCPQFTNAKAFALGVAGLQLSSYTMKSSTLMVSNFISPVAWWISLTVIVVESFGILSRLFSFYDLYFSPQPCNMCHQAQLWKLKTGTSNGGDSPILLRRRCRED